MSIARQEGAMHGGRSFVRNRATYFRLGLERLEPRDLPGGLGTGGSNPPSTDTTVVPTQTVTDGGTNGTDTQTGDTDGDASSYHSFDSSSSTGKTGYPNPKPKQTNLIPMSADKASNSNTTVPIYTNVSPVGYDRGEPVGPIDRIELLSPISPFPVIGPDNNADVVPSDVNVRRDTRTRLDIVTFLFPFLGPSGVIGITTLDEPEPSLPAVTDGQSEVRSPGADVTTTPVTGQVEEPAVRLQPLIAAVIPDGWKAAAEDVFHALDSLGFVPDTPSTAWERVYFWGVTTAAIALGIELARRCRASSKNRDWDERG
jgi:hypothetical protein